MKAATSDTFPAAAPHRPGALLGRLFHWRLLIRSFAAWTLVALVFTGVNYFNLPPASATSITWTQVLTHALGVFWLWALLTGPILELGKQFPIRSPHRIAGPAIHLTAALGAQIITALFSFFLVPVIHGKAPHGFPTLHFLLLDGAVFNLAKYVALVAIAQTLSYYEQLTHERIAAAKLRTMLAETQLHLVQAQLSPHFLYNALHSISELVHRDPSATEEALVWLGDLLRSSLELSSMQTLALEEEIVVLEPYLALQRLRFGKSLRVHVCVPAALLRCRVPTFILQPLVENVTRHAFRDGTSCTIGISAHMDGGSLGLLVEDDGPGFAELPPREGIGLANIRTRLTGLYGAGSLLECRNRSEGGAQVFVRIPVVEPVNGRPHSNGVGVP